MTAMAEELDDHRMHRMKMWIVRGSEDHKHPHLKRYTTIRGTAHAIRQPMSCLHLHRRHVVLFQPSTNSRERKMQVVSSLSIRNPCLPTVRDLSNQARE